MRPRGPSRTDLAGAAILFNTYARLRTSRGEVAVTLDAPSPLAARRFGAQVGGLGEVVDDTLWFATTFESVQAVIAMLWPWLSAEMRRGAKAVLEEVAPAGRQEAGAGHP